MPSQEHATILRKDYIVPTHLIDTVFLTFYLKPQSTEVLAKMDIRSNPESAIPNNELELMGEDIRLLSIKIDGNELDKLAYSTTDSTLIIKNFPSQCELEIRTEINPENNTSLSGLYRTSGNYCTQCEAHGFRRITYYLDRPDVLAKFTTRIEADVSENPVMLSNGDLIEEGNVDGKTAYTIWRDPYPKPSYLFALVAGNLVCLEDTFTTKSQRLVKLQIFVEPKNKDKCEHAMRSLKKAMTWDENVYGLEYDLDTYMIVAVDDFNMGAMENKGLNVFNSKYVLASPESATDQDYLGIEGVIAHEYFHNWTGNRVTCRDWFQLSLKEGLTVFRDQEFSADMNSRPVERINDVNILRNFQFREDSSPMAHSVRPDSYVEINNFYTVTIYNKGAEVVRMIHTLLGPQGFRAGMDLYFKRHDGQAVTCDDFVAAMSDATGIDLSQFRNWYSQSGTPHLEINEIWEETEEKYYLRIVQTCPPTPGQAQKQAFHIPIKIGLLDTTGKDMDVSTPKKRGEDGAILLELKNEKEEFVIEGVNEKPVLSFLRGFSAPVKVKTFQTRDELAFIAAYDSDYFNRWDAVNRLSESIILELTKVEGKIENFTLDQKYIEAFRLNLLDTSGDKALLAQALTLPTEMYLSQQMEVIKPKILHEARRHVIAELHRHLVENFTEVFLQNKESDVYSLSSEAMGARSLKNVCLRYLMSGEMVDKEFLDLCLGQYNEQRNMTDVIGALSAMANYPGKERDNMLSDFYSKWSDETLVVDKWLILQATSQLQETLETVRNLLDHEAFSYSNPNKVRSLIGSFCSANHVRFHDPTGAGYRFLTEQILLLDTKNPQIAARLVTPFTNWKRYEKKRRALMQEQLSYLSMQKSLSVDVREIVTKSI